MENIKQTGLVDVKTVETETTNIVLRLESLVISNQEEYEGGNDFLKMVKAQQKKVGETFDPIVERAHQTHKEAIAQRDKFLDPLKTAEKKIKGLMVGYTNEQERKAREEQMRLQKLANQEAEKQRKILEAKIERAKASGKEEKVEVLEMEKENIVPIIAPVVTPHISTPSGVSYRDIWNAEVTDINLIPREYLIANLPALNKIANATKGSLNIPGVKFTSTKIMSSRS